MKTPNIRFDLESKTNKKGESLIILNMSYGYKEYNPKTQKDKYLPFRLSTKRTIMRSDWDAANYRPTKKYQASKTRTLKNYLDELSINCEYQLNLYFNEHNKLPHPNELKEIIKIKLGRTTAKTNNLSITKFIEDFIAQNAKLTITSEGKIGEKQIAKYSNMSSLVKSYETEIKAPITFTNLNRDMFLALLDYANEQYKAGGKHPNGYLVNTIAKTSSTLKAILRKAIESGYELALSLDDRYLNIKEVKAKDAQVFLSEENLAKVIEADTSKSKEFINARNYLILCSFTSLRYEDMAELHTLKVSKHGTGSKKFSYINTLIRKVSSPTNQIRVCIPIFKPVQDILDANNGVFPKFPTNQKLNEQLKKFAKHIGLVNTFDIEEWYYKIDKPVLVQKHLHELIKCHIGRSTFVSNLIMKGVNNSYIEFITHPTKKSTTLEKYYDKTALIDKAALLVKEVRDKAKGSLYSI